MPEGTPIKKLTPVRSALASPQPATCEPSGEPGGKMLCERCSAEMYRMHSVWRCPVCGFKTDCCGW
jgi:hypothetical protein